MTQLRTCTAMVLAEGDTGRAVYAVMVGPMCRGGRAFNSGRAEIVATYELIREKPDYNAMTAKHATARAPAVFWQGGPR
jgi:hypothetical protein